jgi:RNA polymerase sigma factor (sigma-70 family)
MTRPDSHDRRGWVLSMVDEHEGRLTRFAARLLGDEEAARDVVQHAFLRLCDESPDDLEGRAAQWLFTVCRNRAVDLLRTRQRTTSLDRLGEIDRLDARPGLTSPDPAVAAERDDLYRLLRDLIAELPPAQREALDLWTEGFTYRQVAEITGHSEGNTRVLVHRALKTLRGHPVARQLLGEPEADQHHSHPQKPSGARS